MVCSSIHEGAAPPQYMFQGNAAKVCSLAWSPNNAKIAVCAADRTVMLFDENGEKRDKFSTKPIDAKYGKKSYVVKAAAFSPDSTRIAIGQSDNILFVYRIGEEWSDKKVICNKFMQPSAVMCLIWHSEQNIVIGLADGKVRLANVKTNKSTTLYSTDELVCQLALEPNKRGFLSSHIDGSIVRFLFHHAESGETQAFTYQISDGLESRVKDGKRGGHLFVSFNWLIFSPKVQGKICTHTTSAYALLWAPHTIVAAGCDKRVISYNKDGRIMQQFDFSSTEEDEREFTTAALSPSSQTMILGSFDRLRIFNWNLRKGAWDIGQKIEIKYMYTITALFWKPDGSKVLAGALCGNVEMFDCSSKKCIISNKFEITFVGSNQVIVKHIETSKRLVLRSNSEYEISDIKILGKDRYVVCITNESLIIADFFTGKVSEVPWHYSTEDKFYFYFEHVCLIHSGGELNIIEFGNNGISSSIRAEFIKPRLLSICIANNKSRSNASKILAYLVDMKTIAIIDLNFGSSICQLSHESKIDWLTLNGTAKKLVFRDKRMRLFYFDIENESKTALLPYCSFAQTVPETNVLVAQNRDNLCIWYNTDVPERVSMIPVKGEVEEVIRENGKTDVIVNEGSNHVSYTLDESLVEFGSAIDNLDFDRALAFLEVLDVTAETEIMWKQLAELSLENEKLAIAARSYAAIGNLAKVRVLQNIAKVAKESPQGRQDYRVRAMLAIMKNNLSLASAIYVEHNRIDDALNMYLTLHKWDEALELAETKDYNELTNLKIKYFNYLAETGQDDKAADVKEKEGDHLAAVNLFLKANMPARAAKILSEHSDLTQNSELLKEIVTALVKNELYEKAGNVFEKAKLYDKALDCYRKAEAYNPAIELARFAFPQEVVKLEEEWGDTLCKQKQPEAAVNHYIESGNMVKALEAAVSSRQWDKAIQIVDVVDNNLVRDYLLPIAEHFEQLQQYDNAEKLYLAAESVKNAISMYSKAERWEDAHRLSASHLDATEARAMYLEQAERLENQKRFKEAERLYSLINEPNRAIAMYKKAGQAEQMMRLVKQHHSDQAQDAHAKLAKELEESGRYRDAEKNYIEAGEWKSAVNMYRNAEMWEDAYKVAKTYGGEAAPKQVAYLWAKTLGGDSAVKLLRRFNLLEEAIDFASDNGAVDFAFELCRLGMKNKMPAVHLKYARQLEEEGQLGEAESQYLQADTPKEIVSMYINQQDWENAERVAEKFAPESLNDVYINKARIAFEKQEYQKAESYLLRAHKPEIIVKSYKDLKMWSDALRVCKEYLPNLLPQLQEEYELEQLKSGAKGVHSFLKQAEDWINQGEFERAVNCYLKVNRPATEDEKLMEESWRKAYELTVKFIDIDQSDLIKQIAYNFSTIDKFELAADYYLKVDALQEAIDCLIDGREWNKARAIAAESSDLADYVDDRYKNFLKAEGNADQLAAVDVSSAIQMFIEKNQWDKALDAAKQQKSTALLEKYVALYVSQLISQKYIDSAIEVFCKYGSVAPEQNFKLYEALVDECLSAKGKMTPAAYPFWSKVRSILLDLRKRIKSSKSNANVSHQITVERYLEIMHYYSLRSAFLQTAEDNDLQLCALKINISLLRYTDVIPADKAFYEAGISAKNYGGKYENMAFVFLNHFLDLAEAINSKNPELLDYVDFEGTDIPHEILLPMTPYLTGQEHEEVEEWVLAISVDKQLERTLLKDSRGVYEASLLNQDGSRCQACILTGYPVLDAKKSFDNSNKVANKLDWNKVLMVVKTSNQENLIDSIKFLEQWLETNVSLSF